MGSDEPKIEKPDNLEEKILLEEKHVTIIDPIGARQQLGNCVEDDPALSRMVLKVYPRRWIVLLTVALLNNLNTVAWIAFAPIANHVDEFYGFGGATNYFSMVYMLCTIPVGFFAMWGDRRFGLRWTILVAAWANAIGGSIRFMSSFAPLEFRFYVGITGQAIASLAYPFIMFLPTKVAGAWFPDNQRSLATTIGIMSNPVGVLIANLLSPQLVQEPQSVVYLNALTCIPAIFVGFLATFGVNRSEPKLPPTISAGQQHHCFVKGVKKCFTSRQYLILLLVMGGGIGMFNSLYTVMQQLLCPSGYVNSFSGICAALMIIGGVFGATGAAMFVDKTKLYEEAMKVAMGFAVVLGILFLQLVLHRDFGLWILLSAFFFGFMGLASYPVGLQLAAECTYPVSETTSTGLIVLSGQIQSVIYVFILTVFAVPLQPEFVQYQVCSVPSLTEPTKSLAKDMTMSVIIMSGIAAFIVLVLVIFFHPKYRRIQAEKGVALNVKNGDQFVLL